MKNKKIILVGLIVFLMVLVTGCSHHHNETVPSYQVTLFKIFNEDNKVVANSSLKIKGIKVTGEKGIFKAPLEINQQITLIHYVFSTY